jgi:hypothetical protein
MIWKTFDDMEMMFDDMETALDDPEMTESTRKA